MAKKNITLLRSEKIPEYMILGMSVKNKLKVFLVRNISHFLHEKKRNNTYKV